MGEVLQVVRINLFIQREGIILLDGTKTLASLAFDGSYSIEEEEESEGKKLTPTQIAYLNSQILEQHEVILLLDTAKIQ